MKLYLNGTAHEVPIYNLLTPALYDKVSPMLQELANSKGASTAAEQELMERVFAVPELAEKIDLQAGADAFVGIMEDFRFKELVKDSFLKIRKNLFDVITIDSSTIPIIFKFVQTIIDIKKVNNGELIANIQSDLSSEFWMEQDLDGILDQLKFFRETVCKRIRIV